MTNYKTLVNTTPPLIDIDVELAYLKEKLNSHKIYQVLKSVNDVQVFMENHVFAVWDFMSLAKALQKNLTCVETPWYPTKDKVSRRLINEIVLGEESDIDQNNNPVSHFELYVESMNKIGSDTSKIHQFVDEIIETKSHTKAIEKCSIPNGISDFLNFTFETIESNKPHIIASVFTFGREDLIPDMFINIVKTLNENNETKIGDLLYYLERHIEMDGDEHGPMALQMISELCKDDDEKWKEATAMSKKALEMRIKLWDYIESNLN